MILPYLAIAVLVIATVYSAIVSFRPLAGSQPGWIFPAAASRTARILVGTFSLAGLIGGGLWLGMSVRNSTRPASRFLIPEGYTGWVRIEFEIKDAPSLPMEGGEYVIKIPPDGKLRTSSPEQYGWANDHYYYYSAQGERALPDSGPSEFIWGKLNAEASGAAGQRKYEEFFVGSAQQFKQQGRDEKAGSR
jgi:hypothetical protein